MKTHQSFRPRITFVRLTIIAVEIKYHRRNKAAYCEHFRIVFSGLLMSFGLARASRLTVAAFQLEFNLGLFLIKAIFTSADKGKL